MLPFGDHDTRSVAVGDVDGDGDPDAIFGSETTSPRTRLLINDGTGRFVDGTAGLPTGTAGVTAAIQIGDVDLDGDLDVFLGKGTQQNQLLLNDGTGTFTSVTATHLPVDSGAVSAAFGDVDADGDLDIVFANSQGHRLYINNGSGVFADGTAGLSQFPEQTADLALADVDGDGDLDVFFGNLGTARNRLALNDGVGVFTDVTVSHLPIVADDTRTVAFGDIDGDGDVDGFIGNWGTPSTIWLNDGTGFFSDVGSSVLPVRADEDIRDVVFVDVDGDGDLDIYGADAERDWLYLNDGGFVEFAATHLPNERFESRAVAVSDVDSDGDPDLLIGGLSKSGVPFIYYANGEPAEDALYLNRGDGRFTNVAKPPYPSERFETQDIELGDVDGDGDLDAWVGKWDGALVFRRPRRVYLNDGNGGFTDAGVNAVPAGADQALDFGLGDFDGDGDLDCFAVARTGLSELYLNEGTGRFSGVGSRNLPTRTLTASAVAIVDVDGDGDLDALIGSGRVRLYVNDGNASFTDEPSRVPGVTGTVNAIAIGDLDGDGDPDAVIGRTTTNLVFLNNGGSFVDVTATHLIANSVNTRDLALGDVNGDGDLDLFVGNNTPNQLFLNDGSGVFTPAGTSPRVFARTRKVALADIDEDGDLDALMVNEGQTDQVWENDGTGLFTVSTVAILGTVIQSSALAVGDLDGDGDPDLILGSYNYDVVNTNLERQLTWRSTPRVGKRLSFDVSGPSAGVWLFGARIGGAFIPLAPGMFDSAGKGSVGFPVPDNASLVGATVDWQAVVAFPFAFTNVEPTTLSGL